MAAVVALLAIVVALLAVFVVGLLRSHADILRALHDMGVSLDPDNPTGRTGARPTRDVVTVESDTEPTIRTVEGVPGPAGASGQRAHDIAGRTTHGGTRSVAIARSDTPTLLAFLTTGCSTCADFWRAFADGVQLPGDARLVIVTKGPDEESPADVAAVAADHLLTIQSTEAWDDYQVPVAPYFVLVDGRRGVVAGEGAANSWELVSDLLERALADAGYGDAQVRRRDVLLGKTRTERVDRDLRAAGIEPGDPRLYHERQEQS